MEHNKDKSIIVLGGDSTNSMSGYKGGAIAWVEKMIDKKVFWVICQIHTNELPLHHLIEVLDRKTNSCDCFSGPVGKKLASVNIFERRLKFSCHNSLGTTYQQDSCKDVYRF